MQKLFEFNQRKIMLWLLCMYMLVEIKYCENKTGKLPGKYNDKKETVKRTKATDIEEQR